MPFTDIITEMVEGVEGGLAAAVMGTDGLSVQKYSRRDGVDVEAVGVEYGKVVEEARHASELLEMGELEEITITTAEGFVLLRMASPEYYIAFVTDKDANLGKARYLLKRASVKAEKEL